ncbi:MAG: hypothetical protein JNK02_00205, partial [Planctomycetes bacterium]|nr:hypothetical protein [Planctomycetota bacterium]
MSALPHEPPRAAPTRKGTVDAITVGSILLLLLAPTIDACLRDAEARGPRANEMRTAAEFPGTPETARAWLAMPRRIEAWFGDVLGLRDVLIRWHSIEDLLVFGRSPTENATVGRDLSMFYRGESSLEIARGVDPFSPAELEAWRRTLEAQRDAVEGLGAKYLLAIAPNKESIYPEKLPAWAEKLGPSRLDQLLAHLGPRSTIDAVDLRPALVAAKRLDRHDDHAYFPQGTHWYGRGALTAYREITTALKPHFPVLEPLADEELVRSEYGQDSWAERMYVLDRFPQSCLAFHPRAPRARVVTATPRWPDGELVTEVDDARLPRAVFLHDSMLAYFEPLIAEHFRRATFLWTTRFDVARIAAARPDVVVVTGRRYMPLAHLEPGQAPIEIWNSPLSETGVMGFEYGYTLDQPEAL